MNTVLNEELLTLLDCYRSEYKLLPNVESGMTEGDTFRWRVTDEEKILKQFGLPNSRRYYNLLRSFGKSSNYDLASLDRIIFELKREARNFLMRPVLTPAQQLDHAKLQQTSPYDILPELGFTTHHFNIFLYSYLFLNDYASAKEILNDLRLARDNEELPFIFNLAQMPDYKEQVEYRLFQMAGFKFIDAYCSQQLFIPEPLSAEYDKVEEHRVRYFKLTNLLLTEVVFDNATPPTLFCEWQQYGKSKNIQIGVEFEQFFQIMDMCGEKGEYVKNLMKEKLQSGTSTPPEIISLSNSCGNIFISNCVLNVFRALYETANGKFVEENSLFFMLDEMVN